MGQKLVKWGSSTWARLCGTHIYETTGWIYTIWSFMELSRPVVVQHHGHLTLTLDFQGQILKMLYLRNWGADWHGMKGWNERDVSHRILHPLCDFQRSPHPWPRPWIFKVKFWKCCSSGMGGPIDMERKGCESIGCYTHFVTFNFDLNYDLDLGFPRWNIEIAVTQEWEGWLTWNGRDVSWLWCWMLNEIDLGPRCMANRFAK